MSDKESSGAEGGANLKSRLREELRNYLIISAYLFVCLGALLFYKAALLERDGVHLVLLSVAEVNALIVGWLHGHSMVEWRLSSTPVRCLNCWSRSC